MPPHEIQLLITAKNEADRALRELRAAHAVAGRAIQQNWAQVNRANTTSFNRFATRVQSQLRTLTAGFIRLGQAAGRAFGAIGRGASRFAGSIGGLSLLGGGLLATQRAVGLTFEQQRQQALFRATREDAAQRRQLEAFARRQSGGLFTQQQVLGAVTAGRRIQDPTDLMRLVQALRGAAAAEGDLALAVVSVQRAMFEGEAELAERFGLLLREGNLTEQSIRLFDKKVTQLTAAEKAQVVYAEAIRQSANFQNLENEMLKTAAGQWQLFKNRVDETLLSIGNRLQPVLEGILGFLSEPIARLRTFLDELRNAFVVFFHDVGVSARNFLQNFVNDFKRAFNDLVRGVPLFGRLQFGNIPANQPAALSPQPGFGQAIRGLFRPASLSGRGVQREQFPDFVPTQLPSQVPVPTETITDILAMQRAGRAGASPQLTATLQATDAFTTDMRNSFVNMFAEIGAMTDSFAGSFISTLANVFLQIQQILSSFQQTNALRSAAGLAPVGSIHPALAVGAVVATGAISIAQQQSARDNSRSTQRGPRFSHSSR